MSTGALPTDATLDYALGRSQTTFNPHTGSQEILVGGSGGMEMLETWISTLSPDQRARYRMGYWLARAVRQPQTASLQACQAEFTALEQRMTRRLGTDDVQKALDQLIGPPTPDDLATPAGRYLAAEIMAARIRDKQALQGSLADGFTETDETADMASVQFLAAYQALLRDGDISTQDLLVLGHLSRQYENRYNEYVSSVDTVTNIAGTVAAVAAGIVVTVLSGGMAGPLVGTALAKWGAAAAVAGAVAKVGVSEAMGGAHYEATGREGGMDALSGALDGAVAILAASLATRFTSMVGLSQKALAAKMTGAVVSSARAAVQHAGRRLAGGLVEGAIDGFLSGAVGELVLTAADKGTWDRGAWDALCDIGAAVVRGGVIGAGTGGVLSGGMNAAGSLLQVRRGHRIASALAEHLPDKVGDASRTAAREASGASSALDGAQLNEHLRQLQKYGSGGFRELESGTFRYYGALAPAAKPGPMVGRRLVREWDPATGATRTWHETLDHAGRVRIVRPETGRPKIHYTFDEAGSYTGTF